MADQAALIARLEAISEELGDLAIDRLRQSLDGNLDASAEERRFTRARRAVDKAAGLLAGMPDDTVD